MAKNALYYGDNLDILRHYVDDESVDLVYLDPPFKSDQNYNVLFAEKDGTAAAAQIQAFEDTWRWDMAAAESFAKTVEAGGEVSRALQAFRDLIGENDMLAYLSMMAPRLVELRRVLKPTGSLYLHCDPTASHYLKLLLDAAFGPGNFRNEIIWRRTGANKAKRTFGRLHQTIFFYTRSDDYFFTNPPQPYTAGYVRDYFKYDDRVGRYRPVILTGPGTRNGPSGQPWREYNPTSSGRHWQPASYLYEAYKKRVGEDLADYPLLERLEKLDDAGMLHWGPNSKVPQYKWYLDDAPGVATQDIWAYQPGTEGCIHGRSDEGIDQDVKWLTTNDAERLGYPTQKPLGIMERIIRASSQPGDVVLDPFCGCGTTIDAAEKLGRKWIGIDITHLAITLIKHRLRDTYADDVSYEVYGEPASLSGAEQLASEDRYQFEWWALGLVGARPQEQKKGADAGIDGRLYFHDEPGGQTKQIILSVKSGKPKLGELRDLRGVVDREGAEVGVLITLQPPTGPMKKEAASAGFYDSPWGKHPRLQILTIQELLDGGGIDYPPVTGANVTFKRARRAQAEKKGEHQGDLLDG